MTIGLLLGHQRFGLGVLAYRLGDRLLLLLGQDDTSVIRSTAFSTASTEM